LNRYLAICQRTNCKEAASSRKLVSIKIPLPKVKSTPNAKAHPYPIQVAIQTMEFLQATILYASFMDIATGELIHMPGGMAKVEQIITDQLNAKDAYYEAWGFIEKYREVLGKTIFQSVLIAMNSHWDWYIRKLGEFITYAQAKSGKPILSVRDNKRLNGISLLPIIEQINVIETSSQITLDLSTQERVDLREMSLLRNLGLHNRWEVDQKYLNLTNHRGFEVGDIRVFDKDELWLWHKILLRLVHDSSLKVAITFIQAPLYL
jgi:hypothetical protein